MTSHVMAAQDQTSDQWRNLLSSDPEQASRAADTLYGSISAAQRTAQTFLDDAAGKKVIASVEAGHRTAAAILLLGYVTGADSVLTRVIRDHGDERVKLHSWSRPVPLRVAATAALSRLGDAKARRSLLEGIDGYDSPTRVFLLDILPSIDAPEVWHALSTYLDDAHEIPEDVPSGADQRRMCDHAVDAFLDRFNFPVSFGRKPGGRYDSKEVGEARRALRQFAPQ
jgi:hypothetical protein